MAIYLVNYALIIIYRCFASLGRVGRKSSSSNGFLWSRIIAIQLILLLSLRSARVGRDLTNYSEHFNNPEIIAERVSRVEVGYATVVDFLSKYFESFQAYLIVFAFLAIVPIAYSIRRCSASPTISWFLYVSLGFYSFAFSGIRQSTAIAFIFLAFIFVQRRRAALFFIVVAIAVSFHLSAIIFAPAYFLYRLPWRRSTIPYAVVGVILVIFSRERIFSAFISSLYPAYETVERDAFLGPLFWFILLAVAFYLYFPLRGDGAVRGMLNILVVAVLITTFATLGTNVFRAAQYYFIPFVFLFARPVGGTEASLRRLVRHLTLLSLVGYFIVNLLSDGYGILPYESIL